MYSKFIIAFLVIVGILFLLDLYIYFALRIFFVMSSQKSKKLFKKTFWSISAFCLVLNVVAVLSNHALGRNFSNFILVFFILVYIPKMFMLIPLLLDDLRRLAVFILRKFGFEKISRWKFLLKISLYTGILVFVLIGYSVFLGNDNLKIRRQTIYFKNLPPSFNGKKIALFSDIHCSNVVMKGTVNRVVEAMMKENPDIIFFLGDLVVYKTSETEEFLDIFKKVKAPLGVYTVLGNHDYGDYSYWKSKNEKEKNLEDLKKIIKDVSWDLLLNENRLIGIEGDTIAVIGIENWGHIHRFPKRGDIKIASKGAENIPFKILLSHDPSFWKAEILTKYKDINITFSGHTHAFQFGYKTGKCKWSPSEYLYEFWDGLYNVGEQYLYVNRGMGNVGIPGRFGMFPEITIIELRVKK
ncbi:MAG: metallophosphoesterase [Bacteroidales bacterium]|nr:metallophosphoesterase [Bacteroidales bacterium]